MPISALRAELRRDPDNPEAHNVLGRLLGRSGADPQQVATAFREAIRLRPNYPEALNHLGLVLTQTDQTNEAIAAFRDAIRLRPDFAEARANLGGVLVIVDADEAIAELNEALALDSGLVNAQYNLSRAYNRKTDRAKEMEHLEKAIEIAPHFAKAHFALGRALVADRQLDEAVRHLETALELDPSLGEARYQLGLALVRGRSPGGSAARTRGQPSPDLEQAAGRDGDSAHEGGAGRTGIRGGEQGDRQAAAGHRPRAVLR